MIKKPNFIFIIFFLIMYLYINSVTASIVYIQPQRQCDSSWIIVKNDEKLKKILSISNNHLYNHHNKNAIFNSRETKMVINNLLKKTDLCQLDFTDSSIEDSKK